MKRFFLAFLLVSIFCFSVNAQFVQVKSVNADIRVRVLPESESKIVCEALKGDIFIYKNQENEWIEIEMFSGDPRYIHSSKVEMLTRGVSAPFSNEVCPHLKNRLLEVKEKTLSELDNINRNILFDRYVLDIIHEFKLQPVVYQIAIGRCFSKNETEIIKSDFDKEEINNICVPIEKPKSHEGISPQNNSFSFRETSWGMSKEQVKEAERESIFIEEDAEEDIYEEYDGSLVYQGELNGIKCKIHYQFVKDRLITARYRRTGDLRYKEEFINNYKNLKSYFINIYGRPENYGIEEIEDNPMDPWVLMPWENPRNNIYLILFMLHTYEKKGQVEWVITYQSEEGANMSGKLDQKSQERTEAKEYQSESAIKILDWTNRISKTGNYYYVEGKVKNVSNAVTKRVRVKVEALDNYGKLISLEDGYVDPSTLQPNQTGFFSVMVYYNSNIKKFSLNVYWN